VYVIDRAQAADIKLVDVKWTWYVVGLDAVRRDSERR
jgi:hypothetical protein